MIKVVTLGGGSGHSQVLKALQAISDVEITAVCPSTDSGGSTGILAREYGGNSYTGDLTKCVVALAEDGAFAKALSYRYGDGPLESHTVRNLFFHALEQTLGTDKALQELWRLARIFPHRVLPVSRERTELCGTLSLGSTVIGETSIDTLASNPLWHPIAHAIDSVYLKPTVAAGADVQAALRAAEYIVLCPGDLYSSLIPTLLPQGVKEAFVETDAQVVLLLNIMTKRGETDNYTAEDFIDKIEEQIGRSVDFIFHNNRSIPNEVLEKYCTTEQKVEFPLNGLSKDKRLIEAPFAILSSEGYVVSNPAVMRVVFEELFDLQDAGDSLS